MKPRVTLRQALDDPLLLGGIIDGPSWLPWRSLLIAANGEVLTAPERALFQQLTGREREPGQMVEELVGVVGRRGGRAAPSLCWRLMSPPCAIIPRWSPASVACC